MRKKRGIWKRVVLVLLCLGIVGGGLVLGINTHIKKTAGTRIISQDEAAALTDVDCILVLGCGVREDGTPSHMLEDRLKRGVALYGLKVSPKLLMSGDHGRVDYNEVGTMKQYALDAKIPSEDVFMDHAGFSTYESLYRAKEIFGAEKLIVVSQEYHLYRALYIAERMGLEAYGVSADYRTYWGQTSREIREILARAKDFANTIFWPEPTFLGEAIPVSGNGDLTNDTEKE
jgi:vancomycin permeability regulator SanA